MYRTINVYVDRSSWSGVGKIPSFPAAFAAGVHSFNLSINPMSLIIDYLTTLTSVTGALLAESWAWVRYLAAIIPRDRDLHLTRSYADPDAYQKTILGDDFGMEVPMIWLMKNLSLIDIADGYYPLQCYGASHDAYQHRIVKRGPNETSDFVVQGHDDKWHILECKGTQPSEVSRDRQIDSGISQELSVIFSPGHTGQRLVSGLSIGIEDSNPSYLRVIDPVPEDPVIITGSELELAKDAATCGVMAKLLWLTGFETVAEAAVALFGKPQATSPSTKKTGKNRVEFPVDCDRRVREELLESTSKRRLFSGRYRGREVTFQLPRPTHTRDDMISKVTVRQSMNVNAIDLFRKQPTTETLIDPSYNHRADMMGTNVIQDGEKTVTLQIGNILRSELIPK